MKKNRQAEILSIIHAADIETQEQLLEALSARGIRCTQATISRDIKELQLAKRQTEYGGYKYVVAGQADNRDFSRRLKNILREGAISCDLAQNIVVVKTMPGLAGGAGAALDEMGAEGLVGSLAGDDTVLLLMRTVEQAQDLCAQIRSMLK